MLSGNNKPRIQAVSKKKETMGSCFPMLQNKTIWKLKINDIDYKIALITHKILPKKQLFVNDVLQESNNTYRKFKFFLHIEGQLLTVSQKKDSTNLLINKKPFYSFQDIPDDLSDGSKKDPISLNEIDLEALKKEKTQSTLNIISQKAFDLGPNHSKEKEIGKTVSQQTLEINSKNGEGAKRKSFDIASKGKEENIKRVASQKVLELKEEENLKPKSSNVEKKVSSSQNLNLKNEENSGVKKSKRQSINVIPEVILAKGETEIKIREAIIKPEEIAIKSCNQENRQKEPKEIIIFQKAFDKAPITKENSKKADEELENDLLKLKDVLKPNSNLDRMVKDMDFIRSSLRKINKRIEEFLASGLHATKLFESKEKIISAYKEVQSDIKKLKAKEKINNILLSCLSDLDMNIENTFKQLNDISEKLKIVNTPMGQDQCVICMEKKVTHACVPCGHLKYCEKCIELIIERKECAICRTQIESVYKIFT